MVNFPLSDQFYDSNVTRELKWRHHNTRAAKYKTVLFCNAELCHGQSELKSEVSLKCWNHEIVGQDGNQAWLLVWSKHITRTSEYLMSMLLTKSRSTSSESLFDIKSALVYRSDIKPTVCIPDTPEVSDKFINKVCAMPCSSLFKDTSACEYNGMWNKAWLA